jgi:hypothetical protein
MKLDDLRNEYQFYTGKVSELARQLALAGLAIVWIFKAGSDKSPTVPHPLVLPTILLGGTLVFDFAQYLWGSILYQWMVDTSERAKAKRGLPDDHDFGVRLSLVRPMEWFLYLKAISVIAAYALLAVHLFRQLLT